MWESPHPLALRVNPDANRPTVIGSIWRRREPEGDDPWDGPVRIVGVFDLGNDAGGLELCVQPVEFGQPVMTASGEEFAREYRRAEADDATVERVEASLRDLEARAAAS
jgi:hypothetical protein